LTASVVRSAVDRLLGVLDAEGALLAEEDGVSAAALPELVPREGLEVVVLVAGAVFPSEACT
jgi:hypothetical protein